MFGGLSFLCVISVALCVSVVKMTNIYHRDTEDHRGSTEKRED